MNKKLGLDFAGWLWAVSRNKVNEFYESNYGYNNGFQIWIGGRIVKQFFMDCPELLNMAYRYLHSSWQTLILDTYKDVGHKIYQTKAELNFDDFSWLLFKALNYSLDKSDVERLVEGDWQKLFKELDEKFLIDEEE